MSTSCPATTSRWLNCCFIRTPSLWQHHFEGVLLCTFSNDDAWILAAASSPQFGLLSQSLTPFSVSLFHISSSLSSLFLFLVLISQPTVLVFYFFICSSLFSHFLFSVLHFDFTDPPTDNCSLNFYSVQVITVLIFSPFSQHFHAHSIFFF